MAPKKSKTKHRSTVLRLSDLDHSKSAVLNSLTSLASRRTYEYAIEEFIAWYCSEPRLAFNRVVVSRKGNCWDNACSETLFGSLKVERLHGQRFETIREAKDEVLAWLLWYNRTRMHSTLNYVSPVQFEQDWMETTVKIAA